MTDDSASVRALMRVVGEARSLEPAERDWRALEDSLMKRVTHAPRLAKTSRRRPALFAVAASLVIAVGGAVLVDQQREAVAPRAQVHPAPAPTAVRGQTLSAGSALDASEQPIRVDHPGRARWVLSRGSKAVVTRTGDVIVLALERGSVDVDVVPQPVAESFVVEAGSLRVAVHGTKFRVERGADVRVTVHEGTVAVGRAGESASLKMWAPADGTFAFDGRERRVEPGPGGRVERAASAAGHATARSHNSRSAPAASVGKALPAQPSIGDVELGVAQVSQTAQSCFASQTSAQPGVEISVRTTLSFDVLPDGNISKPAFEPPLAPAVESCTLSALSAVRFAASAHGISVSRVLELTR